MHNDPNELIIGFGTALRLRRETAGLTQEALGDLLGTDGSTISRYESMQTAPKNRFVLERLAQIFNTSIDALVRGEIIAKRPANLLRERVYDAYDYDALIEYPRLQWLLSIGWQQLSAEQKHSLIDFFEYQVDRALRAARQSGTTGTTYRKQERGEAGGVEDRE